MDLIDPTSALYCVVVSISFTIVCIVRGYREKEKTAYLVAMIPFLMFLATVSLFLNQHSIAIIFFVSTVWVAALSLPGVGKYNKRKLEEALARVDLSDPIRLRDLFTNKGLFKLAHRWGIGNAIFVLWLFMTPIIGGGLLVLSLWLKYLSIGYIISYTFTFSTGSAFMTYSAVKSALEEKPSEVARVRAAYISLNAEDLYRKLLDTYIRVWGSRLGGTRELENNIQSCMKQGLSREEAIRKIAAWEFEGIPWET